MTVVSALATIAQHAKAAADASQMSIVRSTSIHTTPPETVATFPAIIHVWDRSSFNQFPYGQTPTGFQSEEATIVVYILTNAPTMSRAQSQLLPIVDAYRTFIAQHQALSNTVRQVILTSATQEEVEYNGKSYYGATLTLDARIYHATTWVE